MISPWYPHDIPMISPWYPMALHTLPFSYGNIHWRDRLLHHVGHCLHLPAEPHFNLKFSCGENNAIFTIPQPNHHFYRYGNPIPSHFSGLWHCFTLIISTKFKFIIWRYFSYVATCQVWISRYFVKFWFHEFHVLPQGPCSKVFFWRDFTSWSDQNRPKEPTMFFGSVDQSLFNGLV